MAKKKNKWIALMLNLIFLGGGYIYLKKRKIFGYILILGFVIMSIEYFIGNFDHITSFTNLAITHSISWAIITIALGYDAYQLAQENKEGKHNGEEK